MKAYLEKIGKFEWFDDFVYISRQPLENMGYEIAGFDGSDMDKFKSYNFQQHDIVVGSVEATVAFFEKMKITVPKYLGYPESIKKYLGRTIVKVKFAELYNKPYPFFVKPADDVKKFTGSVIRQASELDFIKKAGDIENDSLVYITETVDIVSEYRCFVHHGILKGIQWYRGDFCKFPDVNLIQNIIKEYTDAAVAYTADVGILKDGHSILIELNDLWAISSYGLSGQIYSNMVVDRFKQIMGT